MDSEETLQELIYWLMDRLCEVSKEESDDYLYGLKTAYVETLEKIQETWKEAKNHGLAFDIERMFPL